MGKHGSFIKRCTDIIISSVLLIILLPVMIITAIAIKLDSKGPVFFVQDRTGLNGKPFKMVKFRGMVNNALEAGPTIPFPNFSKLFKSWLKILTTLSEEQRDGLFSAYIIEVSQSPQKLINFHLDGILEIFLTLEKNEKEILANTIKKIINNLSETEKRKILIVIPDNAKIHLKF
ncbi:MAG: sugar transferase [Bacteroidetes bacterium]|nr:sugar transferase [Bacteroidota bacterium]